MSGNSGAWGIAMWKDGQPFPGQDNGISLSGGHAVDAHLPTAPLGFLTLPPDGLGVPPVRAGDVAFAQRDGVVQFADYYEPRQITLQVDIPNEGCPGCAPGPTTEGALSLPGIAQGRAYTPDSAPLSIVGDIDIRVHVAMVDWTPPTRETLLSKYDTSDQRSYRISVNEDGILRFAWSPDGTEPSLLQAFSTVAPSTVDGEPLWIRVTLDVDNGAGGYTVTFYTSTNGLDWDVLGEPVTGVGVTSIFDSTAELTIGSFNEGFNERLIGEVYYAEVRDGIDGTIVASPDFSAQGARTQHFYDEEGNLWRVESPGSIIAVSGPTPLSARQKVARLTQEWSRNCSGATLVIFSDCHDPEATEEEKVYLGPYLVHGRPRVADVTWRRSDVGGASVLLRFDAADARLLLAQTEPGDNWSGQQFTFLAPNENLAPDPDLSEQTMTLNGATVSDNHFDTGGPSGPDGGPWFSRFVITPNTTSPFAMATSGSGTSGIPVVAGQPYSFAWWAMKDPAGGQATRADWTWYDAAGAVINANNGAGQSAFPQWSRFVQENAIAPVGAAFLQVRLIWTGTALADQTLGFAQVWINQGATSTAPEQVEVVGTLCTYPLIHLDSTLTAPIVVTYGHHEFTYNEDITGAGGRVTVDTRYGRATDFTIDVTQNLTGDYSSPLEPGVHDVQVQTANPADTGTVSVEWANAVVSG